MISIRDMGSADISFMMRLASDTKVTKYIPGIIADENDLKDWLGKLSSNDHEYIISYDGADIGECSLTVCGDSAEIGVMLLPELWNKGFGTEVIRHLLDVAAGMGKIEATAVVDVDNAAAQRILEKNGFEKLNIGWMLGISEEDIEFSQKIINFTRSLR